MAAPAPATGAHAAPARYGPEPRVVPEALERSAMAAAADALGGRRPTASPALVLAARELARRAAGGDPAPLRPGALRAALSDALSYDPAPAAFLTAGPAGEVVDDVARAIAPREASHVGAGAAMRGATAYLVVLASRREARLEPFPRNVAPGERASLRGELSRLERPRVFVTLPSGRVREAAVRGERPFEASLAFPDPGRYLVEVVGLGPTGPEVAALFAVSCGGVPLEAGPEPALPPEPEDPAAAEAQVVKAINGARLRQGGLAPLRASPALAEAARRHSAAMLARGQLAHLLPGSEDAVGRLRRARIPFRRVLENIALGPTSLAAHAAAEESPAHRDNILSPAAAWVGAGVARGRLPTGEPVVYLTEIFVQPVDDASDGPLSPEGRVREAIWRERERLRLPALLSDSALDEMAREAARAMLMRGEPSVEDLSRRALGLRRAASAADAFVAASPEDALRSRNLRNAAFRRVGVGVAVGDSRYGAGLLWIAVVYTD
jgi:uncharacterized protein YkwD